MSKNSNAGNTSCHAQLPEPLRSAVVAHEDGDLETAYPLYRQFVADNPKQPTALQLFGLLLSQLGQYDPAIKLMRESLSLYPDQAEVANNLGNALSKAGRIDDAIESYKNALDILPNYIEALRNLGLCYARSGRGDEALESFERCVEIRPEDETTWLAIGNLHRATGELDNAIEDFEKAVEAQPDFAEAHHNLGVCLRLVQRPEDALQHYELAKNLGMDRAELHHNIGNAYIDLQQADPAIDAYREALRQNPGDLDTHSNLNSLLWQQDYLDDYLESYVEAIKADPEAITLRLAYATALNKKESFDTAEAVLRDGLQHTGESSALISLLAYTMEGQDRWDEALRMHDSAVNKPDAIPNQLTSYARALLACQKPEEALQQVQAAAALTPFNQRALAYLGLCWRVLGDERDAYLNDYENLVCSYKIPVPDEYRDIGEFNERLTTVLEPLHIGLRHPAEQTLRGGSQTSGNLFERRDPEIRTLVAALKPCIADYIERFPGNTEHPLFMRRTDSFDLSSSWSVRLAKSGYHTMHTHPLGWISSSYYVQVPTEVTAGGEHGGGIKFGEPDIDIGEAGKARLEIQPAVGKLVLFPSYMWHGTVPFDSDQPRMTTPFDVTPI